MLAITPPIVVCELHDQGTHLGPLSFARLFRRSVTLSIRFNAGGPVFPVALENVVRRAGWAEMKLPANAGHDMFV